MKKGKKQKGKKQKREKQKAETQVAERTRAVKPPPVVAASPFHAPFQELAKSLKAKPASPVPLSVALRPASGSSAPAAAKSSAPAAAKSSARPAAAKSSARPAASNSSARPATANPSTPLPVAPAPTVPPAPVLSDAEALAASMTGVARLAATSPRVRIRRKVDLSSIAAKRKEDLDSMARADGFDVSFEDRYVRARAAGVSRETLMRLTKGEFSICAHLDLHGMPLEDARHAVDDFLASQQKRGHRCVLLVTGKGKNSPGGQGVLREQVPEWLARGPSSRRVLAFASARPCDGGVGALVVLMRATSSSKNQIDVERGGVGPLGT